MSALSRTRNQRAISVNGNRATRTAACEALESRRLLTVVPVAGFTPPAQTGAAGSSDVVELTRYFDNAPANHTVRMSFPTGTVDIQTFDAEVPQNVQNFLRYVRGGSDGRGYDNSIFQRFVSGFVLQGGSGYADGTQISTAGQPTVPDEVPVGTGRQNLRGTLAFARVGPENGGGPNTATSGFFFNLADNASNLDNQNGGFDVFGQVTAGTDRDGTAVLDPVTIIDRLAALPTASRTVDDAIVLLPGVTFTAVSDNPANVRVVNPTGVDGKLVLEYVGAAGSTANISISASDAGQATPATGTFVATVAPGLSVSLGAGGAKSASFTDADLTDGTVTLSGPGSASIDFGGTGVTASTKGSRVTVDGTGLSISGIALTGTTAASTLTISGKGGDQTISLGGLTAAGALKALNGKGVALTGALSASGAVGSIALGAVTGSTISVGGFANAKPVSMSFGVVTDTSITSASPIKSLRATSFVDSDASGDAIAAPAIGTFVTTGDSAAALSVEGAVKSINVGGGLSGNVTARTIGSINVKQGITGSAIFATQDFAAKGRTLGSVKVGGAITNVTIRTDGNIGQVTANALSGSDLVAGLAGQSIVLPTEQAGYNVPASIASVKVKSTTGSNVIAARLGKIDLGEVTTANSATAFGVVADQVAGLTGNIAGSGKINFKKVADPAAFATQLTAANLALADLVLRVV